MKKLKHCILEKLDCTHRWKIKKSNECVRLYRTLTRGDSSRRLLEIVDLKLCMSYHAFKSECVRAQQNNTR